MSTAHDPITICIGMRHAGVVPLIPARMLIHPSIKHVDIPPLLFYATPFTTTTTLHNTSPIPQRISVSMTTSESFVFAGHKTTRLTILPLASVRITGNLVAVACGRVVVPRVRCYVGGTDEKDKDGKEPLGKEVTDVRVRGGVDGRVTDLGSGSAVGEVLAFVRPRVGT
ncbi:hypothetical protein HKX48_001900 [Thoreauomyces humboldtii]|nr:hypothetical protein HKX48_001900 [Thoreauomyces humboldtii]